MCLLSVDTNYMITETMVSTEDRGVSLDRERSHDSKSIFASLPTRPMDGLSFEFLHIEFSEDFLHVVAYRLPLNNS